MQELDRERKLKLEEILSNEQLMKIIGKVETKREMQQVFADNGLKLSDEEIDGFINMMNHLCSAEELNSDELAQVSGGVAPWAIFVFSYNIISKFAKKFWNLGRDFADRY